MHPLNYAPGGLLLRGSREGGREGGRAGGLLSSHSVMGTAVIGLSRLLPCPEKLDGLLGQILCWRTLRTSRGHSEQKWRQGTWLGVAAASGKHHIYEGCGQVLKAPCPHLPFTAATLFSRPEDQPPPEFSYCYRQTCLSPGLWKPKAVLRSGGTRGLDKLARGTREQPSPTTMGEGAGNRVSSFSSPLGFERWNTSMPAGLP